MMNFRSQCLNLLDSQDETLRWLAGGLYRSAHLETSQVKPGSKLSTMKSIAICTLFVSAVASFHF